MSVVPEHTPHCKPEHPDVCCILTFLKKRLSREDFDTVMTMIRNAPSYKVGAQSQISLDSPIRVLERHLSMRTFNCLKNKDSGVTTIGDILTKSDAKLLEISHFGLKSLTELKEVLEKLDIQR